MIITDPTIIDSLNFNNMRKIKIMGLGDQDLEAYITQISNVKIGKAISKNLPTTVLKEDLFNLSGYLGLKIYGLIGYSFFKSFIVDIKYGRNTIKFNNNSADVKFKGVKIPMIIKNLKPYVKASIELENGEEIEANFLIDTGASHSLSLEMLNNTAFPLPQKKIASNLGLSISGQITGFLARINKFGFGGHTFKNVIAGFPDYKSISDKVDSNRNGVIGAEVLSRFNIQLNYKDGFMHLKPNVYFKRKFEHNMVGMIVYLDQKTYSRAIIGDIEEGSPAQKAGLIEGDEILKINFKPIKEYNLNDIDALFKSKENDKIIFEVFRNEEYLYKVIRLEKRI